VRWVAAAFVAILVVVPSCGGDERPEGVVERWLVSLNQGVSGEPHAYALDEVTETLAPDWDTRDPGAYDEIDVGAPGEGGGVPFRLTLTDGSTIGGVAMLAERDRSGGPGWVVVAVDLHDPPPTLGGVWPTGAPVGAWLVAVGVAVLLSVLAVVAVGATKSRT
jgi:hypothetical protein